MSPFSNSRRFAPLLLAFFALTGCPKDDPTNLPGDGGGTISGDAGIVGDAGGSDLVDAGPLVQNHQPSNAITAGGGKGSNENYKVRVLIGGPAAIGPGAGENTKVNLGAGAVQHGN